MRADIQVEDPDQNRTYHLEVHFTCRPEIGAAPGYCLDLVWTRLDQVVVWFDKEGLEANIDFDKRKYVERFIERKYDKEIRELCIEAFERAQAAA